MKTSKILSHGAALSLLAAAAALPARAQAPGAAKLFIGTVLTAELPGPFAPAAPVADDGRGDAGEAFVAAVLKPQLARGTAGFANAATARQPGSDAVAAFVASVLSAPQAR